ncbi:MAG: ParA family protein [Myxococcota bacterium]|nr:ParA family protein [Myxococcota bacterium]
MALSTLMWLLPWSMAAMTESCSVCSKGFDVQFRYQMEERDGGFAFFCSHECHTRVVSGETSGGATCWACEKRFYVELVSQVVRIRGERRHACSEDCRRQILAEAGGVRLAAVGAPVRPAATVVADALTSSAPVDERCEEPRRITVPPAASRATAIGDAITVPRRRIHAPARLAVFNHKGGTGKTTTSVSIAAGLASRGVRVLLVDTDSQGNVAVSLGVKAERSLYHVLVMGMRPMDAAVPVRPNLDVLVSNETLAAAELYLAGRQNRDRILRDRLASAFDHYDIIVLDCSPSLSLLNQNALVVADGIVVPVACDFLSLVGVRQVIKTVKNVNALLHHPVQIHGVLPTFYDARARICRDAVEAMREHFGDRVLPPIRQATRIKEAPAQGKSIFEFAPESNAAEDYGRVVDLLVDGPQKTMAHAVGS